MGLLPRERPGSGVRRLVPLLFLAAILPWGTGEAAAVPGYATEDVIIRSHDGVELRATVYVPVTPGPHAGVILTHGFGADRTQMADAGKHFAEKGWVGVAYDARGFGQSGGYVELDGPNEVADVQTLVDFLAARTDTLLDAQGDPRVGMFGGSYGGAIQLLAAAADPRIDVLVPQITWNDLVYSLYPNEVVKQGWVTGFYATGQASGFGATSAHPNAGALDPKITEYFAYVSAHGELNAEIVEFLRARSPATVLDRVNAPALLLQGWRDTLFTTNEASRTYDALRDRGVPARLIQYSGGHGYDDALGRFEVDKLNATVDAWFDYWLDGVGSPEELYAAPVGWWDILHDLLVGEQDWGVPDATPTTLYLESGTETAEGRLTSTAPTSAGRAVAGAGGLTSYSEVPYFQPYLPSTATDAPATSASYVTEPFSETTLLVGEPRLSLAAVATTDPLFIFAKLYDVDPAGAAQLVFNQVTPLRLRGADTSLNTPRLYELELTGIAHSFGVGHRLRLVLATSDPAYAANRQAAAVAFHHDAVGTARLEIPIYSLARGTDTDSPALDEVAVSSEDGVWNVTVRIGDENGVASAHLFWRAGDRVGAAAPLGRDGDQFWFRFSAPDDARLRIMAADATGNHGVTDSRPLVGDEIPSPGEVIPGAGFLLALASLGAGLALRRRR